MDINAANLSAMMRTYNTAWQAGIGFKLPVDLSFLFTPFPASGASTFYAWMDRSQKFREWLGDRVFNNIRSQYFEVIHRHFEKSERMKATEILDDLFGVYAPIIQGHGAAWVQLRDWDIVVEVLTLNPVCYTGKSMCATDHKYGDNTIANLVTDALSATTFETAFTDSANWKFSNNDLVRPIWTHLLHGPKLRSTAWGIVDADKIVSGSAEIPNPNFKRVTRVEIPDFAGDYDDFWALVACGGPIKPIARQVRQEAVPFMDTDPATVQRNGTYDWMSDGRLAAAPTFPHLVYMGRL